MKVSKLWQLVMIQEQILKNEQLFIIWKIL